MLIHYAGQDGEVLDREFDYFTKNWLYVVRWADGSESKIVMNPTLLVEGVSNVPAL